MKSIYSLLKLNQYITSSRVKYLGIFLLHLMHRRYLGIFFDPVLACNLRCRMCYFSDPEKRKTLKGQFKEEDLRVLANALFHRALKLQIGCGAEPSLFHNNTEIIRLGKERGIPYISMTTNANLLQEEDLRQFVEAGLNEITLSIHGVTKESYEYFMEKASFQKFHEAMQALTKIKEAHPSFQIRLNYTVNKDNLNELRDFFKVFGCYKFDILQLRPIQEIGLSDYHDFSWQSIYAQYDTTINVVKKECKDRNITCIAPNKHDLIKEENSRSSIAEWTYCYVSPRHAWHADFQLNTDTYESYSKRTKLTKRLFLNIFAKKKPVEKSKKNLNYTIQ